MNVRDIVLVIVVLFGNVWNVKAESGTNFIKDASYNDACSADTEVHGQVSSDLFCAQKCSGIEGCVGFFYNITTTACSTVKSVPQTGNDCGTETGSVFYMNPDNLNGCGYQPTLANGRVVVDDSIRTLTCDQFYSVKVNGVVHVGSLGAHGPCDIMNSVDCVLACHSSDALVTHSLISASSTSTVLNGQYSSRLDSNEAWIPTTVDQQQYLQYVFNSPKIVNEIITQGGGSNQQWTTSYKLHFSTDCDNYVEYGTVFNGNVDISSHVSNMINPAILAKCVRVNPQAWNDKIAMRVELKGCKTLYRS